MTQHTTNKHNRHTQHTRNGRTQQTETSSHINYHLSTKEEIGLPTATLLQPITFTSLTFYQCCISVVDVWNFDTKQHIVSRSDQIDLLLVVSLYIIWIKPNHQSRSQCQKFTYYSDKMLHFTYMYRKHVFL